MGLAIRLVPLWALAALAGCGEPEPGLETPERTAALERCDVKLAALASGEEQLKRLCDCTTGRLAQQGFTLTDLEGEHRDRAMEQVRWCMTQSGAIPLKTPGGIEMPAETMPEPLEETGEIEESGETAPAPGSEAEAPVAAEPDQL
jgi:hypothetical protein